jgi:DNA-binding response OmpR family regulator
MAAIAFSGIRCFSQSVQTSYVDAVDMLASVLQLWGFEVKTAHTAEAALAQVAEWRPDAAVLDIGLPDASGNDLARRLRNQPWGRDLLLIAVTGWGQDKDRERTSEAEFDAHLVKPVDPQQVRDLIEAFAKRRTEGVPATRGLLD